MPNSETAKTKWTLKRLVWGGLLLLFVTAVASVFVFEVKQSSSYALIVKRNPLIESRQTHRSVVTSEPWTYYLTPARSAVEQEKGLGGRKKLHFNAGMIFLYDVKANRCFWMKDMQFAIDIIWVDDAKKVTAIEHNVDPATYPNAFCHDAKYVIELNADEAAKAGIKQGQQLTF